MRSGHCDSRLGTFGGGSGKKGNQEGTKEVGCREGNGRRLEEEEGRDTQG